MLCHGVFQMVLWVGTTIGWDGLRLSWSSEVEFRALVVWMKLPVC